MRLIDKLQRYNLDGSEVYALKNCHIINWCGGKGWFDFDRLLKMIIQWLPWLSRKKKDQLFKDIQILCNEHDVDFRFKKWFVLSTIRLSISIFRLLTFTTIFWRITIALFFFLSIIRYGKSYYWK